MSAHIQKFDVTGINFPMKLTQIKKFSKLNEKHKLRINVFILEKTGKNTTHILPAISSGDIDGKEINLLAIKDGGGIDVDKAAIFHYFIVKNIDRLLTKKYDNGNGKSTQKATHCRNCFYPFRSKAKRDSHYQDCVNNRKQRIQYPELDNDGNPPTIAFKVK